MKEQLLMIRTIILLVGLIGFGLEDLRKKQVSLLPLILMAAVGGGLSIASGDWKDWTVVLRFLPGSVILLFAWLTKESIGYGDALVLLCMGCFLSVVQFLNVCMCALTLSGVWALFLLLVRKKSRKTEIAFIPFLLVGYGVMMVL